MPFILSLLVLSLFGVGAFFRRWWGGWERPSHWLKIPVGLGLGLVVGILFLPTTIAALVFGFFVGLSFLNPFHTYGQRMGNGGPSLFVCLLVMGGSYGAVTTIAALWVYFLGGPLYGLFYAPMGVLPAFAYAASWMVFNKYFKNTDGTFKKLWHTNDLIINGVATEQWFIDGPTGVGELALGAVIIGGFPLLAVL